MTRLPQGKPPSNLGDAIKEIRQAFGDSQEHFARRIGTTTRTVARWEASESLSPSVLSHLRSVAIAANTHHVAQMLEEKLRENRDPIILKLTHDELRNLVSLLMKTRRYPLLLARLMTLVEPMKRS